MNYKSFSLIIFALLCGALVSGLYALTREQIRINTEDYANRQLQETIGSGGSAELEPIETNRYRILDPKGGLVFLQHTEEGYNGHISLWIAVDNSGDIRGVRVASHQETPGIGDFIDTSVSSWINQFEGQSLENFGSEPVPAAGDDRYDQVSGATITSRAVIRAVHQGLLEDFPK